MSALPKPTFDVCGGCGKLFAREAVKLCPGCRSDQDKRFALVRSHLDLVPGQSIADIALGTGLSVTEVSKFMHEGRLTARLMGDESSCSCDGSGERCDFCRNQLAQQFQKMQERRKAAEGIVTWSGGNSDLNDPGAGGSDDDRVRYIRRHLRGE